VSANPTKLSESIQDVRQLSPTITLDQRVGLLIEPEGFVHLRIRERSDDWSTIAIRDGLTLELSLPDGVRPEAVVDWLAQPEISTLLGQIIGEMGEDVDYNQARLVGTLTGEGEDAYATLDRELTARWYGTWSEPGDVLTHVEAAEWFGDTQDEILACATLSDLKHYINLETADGHPQMDQDGCWIVLYPAEAMNYAQEIWLANMAQV